MDKNQFDFVPEFKSKMSLNEKLQVVDNPNTGKRFVSTSIGNFRCQQTLETEPPAVVKYMYKSDDPLEYLEGCFVNVKPSTDNVVGEL